MVAVGEGLEVAVNVRNQLIAKNGLESIEAEAAKLKKLFTLLFAVVTVAAFAAPKVQKATKLQAQKSEAKIEMKAQKGDLYTGKAGMTKDILTVDTMYMTPTGTFFSA